MTIQHDEGAVTQRAVPGPALYFTSAMPDGDARAVVGILPGYADHAARYAHVMDAWAERGIGSVALDMRGHGRAAGTRGYCARFDEFLDDAAEIARLVSDRARGAPVFLFGHSFGGLVAASSALDRPRAWRGLVLSAPYLGLALAVPAAKLAAGKIASRIAPKLAMPTGIKGAALTHDPERARAYDDDPLVFKEARVRWFTESARAQERVLARAKELTLPLYVVFGTDDPVARMPLGRQFFDAASSGDKTWDGREGLRHETLNEPEWLDIAEKISEWVLARAGA
jgi:alpha-beta hydrolase superfamily lysophospholipase